MLLPILLGAVAAVAPVAAAATPPPGVYHYSAMIAGKPGGSATVTITALPGGLRTEEQSTSDSPDSDVAVRAMTQYDAMLAPVSYSASYTVHDKALDHRQAMTLSATFAERMATVTAGHDSQTFPLGGSSKAFAILDSSSVAGYLLLPAQMHAFNSADETALVPANATRRFLSVIPGDRPVRPTDVPAGDSNISFAGDVPFVIWYDPATLIVDDVLLPTANVTITRKR